MITKLSIGTAQFGMNYGINNSIGKIPEKEIIQILIKCKTFGINKIDTAGLYGNAEEILGDIITREFNSTDFKITTK